MKAYKGFTKDMDARLGSDPIGYEVGKTYHEDKCKTVNCGFHCCENPFECLSYYSLKGDRFCEVEVIGAYDEDDHERIACETIKIVRELDTKEFMYAGMEYMINHPLRKWEQNRTGLVVAEEDAEAKEAGDIAIARGISPVVTAVKGAYIGLIYESVPGYIEAAGFKVADRDGIYFLDANDKIAFKGVKE